MPARSKSQQRLFGMIRNCQKTGNCVSDKIADLSDKISPKSAHDFAATKTKKLPNKVKKKKSTKKKKSFKEWISLQHPEFYET